MSSRVVSLGFGQLGPPHDPFIKEVVRDDGRPVVDVPDVPAHHTHIMLGVRVEPLRDGRWWRDLLHLEILFRRVVALALNVAFPSIGGCQDGVIGPLELREMPPNPLLRAPHDPPASWSDHDAGASLRELMEHMGHDSARAALIYLHTSAERQRAIADQVGENAKAALGKHERSGTRMARKAKGTS
jgi:hypothetical protein